ncbi:MAG: hypothetical protein HFJ42_05495 [Clostridia bacterium]|nr:hypothetical protein [Clostridia bacterium]
MNNIIIADVLYSTTDETFYVLNEVHDNASKYYAETLEDVFNKLKQDKWEQCGKVNRSNGLLANLFEKEQNYIAVLEE